MSAAQDWRARWRSLLDRLQPVADEARVQRLLDELQQPRGCTRVGFVNAHAMNLAASSAEYHAALASLDLLLRDGSGMAILLRRLGLPVGLNMNGTDFIPRLLEAYRGRKVAFWGTAEPFLGQAARRAEAQFGVRVVSCAHGFDALDHYLELAQRERPELIVLGMGMPKQEQLAQRLAERGEPCVVVCGGAILDFLGDKVSRAPRWVRGLGCEWAYRLLLEPRRLFGRYVLGNPLFIWRTWRLD